MSMYLLCDDLIKNILSFLNCKSNICLVNKRFNEEFNCKIVNLPILEKKVCLSCDKNMIKIEAILNKQYKILDLEKYISTIHFKSKDDLLIAEPAFYKFGVVSHYCCDGKGVMFKEI